MSWQENIGIKRKVASRIRLSSQEMASPADFIAQLAEATGPVYSISTACSSSGKALASARALIDSDLADLVICGGVDSLSKLPNNGFLSLESTAEQYCNPLSEGRDGINIGEGAALFLMSKEPSSTKLLGVGETSDAHHISAPDPEGSGAASAMQKALAQAGLRAEQVSYVNMHGTATPKNDEMEAKSIHQIMGTEVPVSSTKRFTGHTLGAAGAIEAGLCWLLLSHEYNKQQKLPMNKSDLPIDQKLAEINISQGQSVTTIDYCLSNSFAFGGNNISLIIGKSE